MCPRIYREDLITDQFKIPQEEGMFLEDPEDTDDWQDDNAWTTEYGNDVIPYVYQHNDLQIDDNGNEKEYDYVYHLCQHNGEIVSYGFYNHDEPNPDYYNHNSQDDIDYDYTVDYLDKSTSDDGPTENYYDCELHADCSYCGGTEEYFNCE